MRSLENHLVHREGFRLSGGLGFMELCRYYQLYMPCIDKPKGERLNGAVVYMAVTN